MNLRAILSKPKSKSVHITPKLLPVIEVVCIVGLVLLFAVILT